MTFDQLIERVIHENGTFQQQHLKNILDKVQTYLTNRGYLGIRYMIDPIYNFCQGIFENRPRSASGGRKGGAPQTPEDLPDLVEDLTGDFPERKNHDTIPFPDPFPDQVAGAPTAKAYKLYIDHSTQCKFIRKSKQRWYLNEHRGKYRYVDASHSHVKLLR